MKLPLSILSKTGLYLVLSVICGLLMTACGGESVQSAQTTTKNVATTTSSATTSTTAVGTAQAATTTPAKASTTDDNNPLLEMFSLIPDNEENLKELTFTDLAALRSLYGIPPGRTLSELSKPLRQSWENSTRHATFNKLFPIENIEQLLPTAGYDPLQLDYIASGAIPGLTLSLAKGRFDYAAIAKAMTASKAQKSTLANAEVYSVDTDLDLLHNPVQKLFLPSFKLALVPNKNMLVSNNYLEFLEQSVNLANGKSTSSIKDNTAVKAMLEKFGSVQAVYLSNNFKRKPIFSISDLDFDSKISPEERAKKIEELKKKLQTATVYQPSVLGGYAYQEPKRGEYYYLLANYYPNSEIAKAAFPVMEDTLRNGITSDYRGSSKELPFSDLFEVTEAQVDGNLTFFKIKLKQNFDLYALRMFDGLPTFWVG